MCKLETHQVELETSLIASSALLEEVEDARNVLNNLHDTLERISEQLEKGKENDLPREAPVKLDKLGCKKAAPGNHKSDLECLDSNRNNGNDKINMLSQPGRPGGHVGEQVELEVIGNDWHCQKVVRGSKCDGERGEMVGTKSSMRQVKMGPLADETGQHEQCKRTMGDIPTNSYSTYNTPRLLPDYVNSPRRLGRLKSCAHHNK